MAEPISRISTKEARSVTLDATLADTPEIDYSGHAGGIIIIPTGSSITTLTWHVLEERGGTRVPLYDKDNVAVTTTVAAARAYPFPVELFGAGIIAIQTNADGAVFLVMKS